jgi:hypothetical protein
MISHELVHKNSHDVSDARQRQTAIRGFTSVAPPVSCSDIWRTYRAQQGHGIVHQEHYEIVSSPQRP